MRQWCPAPADILSISLRLQPQLRATHLNLARVLARHGKVAEALREYREAARLGSWEARDALDMRRAAGERHTRGETKEEYYRRRHRLPQPPQ